MSEFYGQGSRRGTSIRHDPARGRARSDPVRHGRHVRPGRQRAPAVPEALGSDRDGVTVATKFGLLRDEAGKFTGVDGSPEYARQSLRGQPDPPGRRRHRPLPVASRRPGRPDRGDGRRNGRAGGRGQDPADRPLRGERRAAARRGTAAASFASVQSEYSLLERSVESEVLPECVRLGAAFMPFAPLMRGLIARRFTSTDELDETDTRRRGLLPPPGRRPRGEESGAGADSSGRSRTPAASLPPRSPWRGLLGRSPARDPNPRGTRSIVSAWRRT